jgi:fluoride exporter
MHLSAIISVSLGAIAGALFRFYLGSTMNPIFPTLPLGTLAANLIGGFLIGIFMALTKSHHAIPDTIRIAITTGFLGSLTTFSTFSAETLDLISHREFFWTAAIICVHVGGTLFATFGGIKLTNLVLF